LWAYETRTVFLLLALGVLAATAVIGLALMQQSGPPGTPGDLKKFTSVDELKTYLKEHRSSQVPVME